MQKIRLAWVMASACVLAACATGVDSQDGLSSDDAGGAVEASSGAGHDASGSSSGHDGSASTSDTGAPDPDSGSTGVDAPAGNDGSSTQEAASVQDSGTQDTGTPVPDAGTGQDTGTTTGGECGSAAKYSAEALAEVASGTITFCFGGVCAAGYCCYEELNPGDICVAE